MGDASEMILDGILCQVCGVFLGEQVIKESGGKFVGNEIVEVPGFAITCNDCED